MAKDKQQHTRSERTRRLMRKHGADLLAKLEAGTPLRTALAALLLPVEGADDLAERADVKAALARREETLRTRLSDPDRAQRDSALVELEHVFGWRKPGTQTIEEKFGAVLARFRDAHPEGYAVLYEMLTAKKETTADRNRKRRYAQ